MNGLNGRSTGKPPGKPPIVSFNAGKRVRARANKLSAGNTGGGANTQHKKWRASLPQSQSEVKKLELRPYQSDGVENVLRSLQAPKSTSGSIPASVIRTVATGGGKTEEAIALAREYERVLFIAPREMLNLQAAQRFSWAGLRARAVSKHDNWWKPGMEWPRSLRAVMATEKTAYTRWPDFKPDLIIFDEAHHVYTNYRWDTDAGLYAQLWINTFEQLKRDGASQRDIRRELTKLGKEHRFNNAASIALVARNQGIPLYGMTATMWRLNKHEHFATLWGEHNNGPQVDDLVKQDYLTKLETIRMGGSMNSTDVGTARGGDDYSPAQLEVFVRTNWTRFTSEAIDWLIELEEEHGRELKVIAYAINQKSALAMADYARSRGKDVGLLLSDSDLLEDYEEQQQTIADFRAGKTSLLVNVAIATEGIDIPDADAVLMCRPTESLALYQQMAGRCTRLSEGKRSGLVLDCTDNTTNFGSPMSKREYSLHPRGQYRGGSPPPVYCFNSRCMAYIHPAQKVCPECGYPQGADCSKCGKFTRDRSFTSEDKCGRCQRGEYEVERARQIREAEAQRRAQMEEMAKANRPGFDHERYRFTPSTEHEGVEICKLQIDNDNVVIRMKRSRGGFWIAYWENQWVDSTDPFDLQERSTEKHADKSEARREVVELLKDAYGEHVNPVPVDWVPYPERVH